MDRNRDGESDRQIDTWGREGRQTDEQRKRGTDGGREGGREEQTDKLTDKRGREGRTEMDGGNEGQTDIRIVVLTNT